MNPYAQPYNPFAQNTQIIKNYFNKPIVLIQSILRIASIVLAIISAYISTSFASEFMEDFAKQFGAELDDFDIVFEISSNSTDASFLSILPSLIIPVLTIIAFALIYFKSNNSDAAATPKSGFSILYVLSVIYLVAIYIALGAIALSAVAIIIVSSSIDDIEAGVGMIVFIMLVLVAAIVAFFLIYAHNQRNYYKSIKDSLEGMPLSNKGASVFGKLSIFIGIMNAFSIFSMISAAVFGDQLFEMLEESLDISISIDMKDGLLISILATAVSAAISIVDGIIANGYNEYIINVSGGYGNAYQNQAYHAQPYSQPQQQYTQPSYTQPDTYQGYDQPTVGVPYGSNPQTEENVYAQQPQYTTPEPTAINQFADDEKTVSVVTDEITCPKCGNKVSPGKAFCGNCGNRLN